MVSAARLHRRFRLARGVAVLGLDKDAGDFGERCLDLALDTGDRRLDIADAASVVEIEAELYRTTVKLPKVTRVAARPALRVAHAKNTNLTA